MFHKAPLLLCARKFVAVVTIAQFALSSPSATFAQDDHLRPSAAKNSRRVYDVRNALKDGGVTLDAPADHEQIGGNFINVQSNMAGLFRGAQTGGMNTYHAYEQGSNGNLDDHSENRERLEGAVKDMVISMMTRRQEILDSTARNLEGQTKAYNIITDEIKKNKTLNGAQLHARLTEADKNNTDSINKMMSDSNNALS